MLHSSKVDYRNKNYEVVVTNKKYKKKNITYLNIESSFDIETTSIYNHDNEKVAFAYIMMFGIGCNEQVYYSRTWEETIEMFEEIKKQLKLSINKRLIVYVHNLSYEFQFMRKYFEFIEVFAVGERKPIKALTSLGIEFRDSYILSGYSLEKTAENLNKHKIRKLVGNLDYDKIRHHETPLTKEELAYCENDILVVNAYINEQIEQYGDIAKIPLTNTGRVRDYVRNECYYTSKNHRKSSKSKYIKYRKLMNDLTIEPHEYMLLKRAFMGGYTHANVNYTGKLLKEVTSMDLISAYPSAMLSEKFPMSRGVKVNVSNIKELDELCSKYCVVFDILLTDVQSKINQDNYISSNKCFKLVNAIENNGRVFSADMLAMTITDIDYDIISLTYDFKEIQVKNVTIYKKGYLPKSIITSILNLYQDKTVLKGVEGKEIEYLLSKGMLNAIYGMSVTDIVKDEFIYNGEWGSEKANLDEQIDKYNKSKNRFLFYVWGIYVTAYARKNLWTGIIACGDDYIYSDTDSIKTLNIQNHMDYVEWFNANMLNKLYTMCEFYNIDKKLIKPKTIQGKEKPLGIWEIEGTYEYFKTLGAKRYLISENGKLGLTVAGLSKQNGINYLLEKTNNNHLKVFELFNNDMYIPANKTGKMTHTYIDDEKEFFVTDFLNNQQRVFSKSGIHLEKCDFTLSISKKYGEFINNYINGNLYEGNKYI